MKSQEAGNLDSATKFNADSGKIGIFKKINGTIGFGVMQLVSRYMVPPDAQVSNYLSQTPILNPVITTTGTNPEYTVSVVQRNGKAVYDISYSLAQVPGYDTGKDIAHGVENVAQNLVENAISYGIGAAIGILLSTVGIGAVGGYWLDRGAHKLHLYVSKYPGDAAVNSIAAVFVSKASDIDAKAGERAIAQSQMNIETERTKLIEIEKASYKFKLSDIASGDEFTKKYDPVYSQTDASGNIITSNYYPMIAKKLKQLDAELKKIVDADPILKASYTASPSAPKIFKAIIDKYNGGSPSGIVAQLNNAIENRITAVTADMSKTISSYLGLISGTPALDPTLKPLQEYLKDASRAKAFYESFGQKLMGVSSADKTKPTSGDIVLEKFALTMHEQVPRLNTLYATPAELVQDLKDLGFAPGEIPKMGRFTMRNTVEFLTKPWKEKNKHFVRKAIVMLVVIGIISTVASWLTPKKEEAKKEEQKTEQTTTPGSEKKLTLQEQQIKNYAPTISEELRLPNWGFHPLDGAVVDGFKMSGDPEIRADKKTTYSVELTAPPTPSGAYLKRVYLGVQPLNFSKAQIDMAGFPEVGFQDRLDDNEYYMKDKSTLWVEYSKNTKSFNGKVSPGQRYRITMEIDPTTKKWGYNIENLSDPSQKMASQSGLDLPESFDYALKHPENFKVGVGVYSRP